MSFELCQRDTQTLNLSTDHTNFNRILKQTHKSLSLVSIQRITFTLTIFSCYLHKV